MTIVLHDLRRSTYVHLDNVATFSEDWAKVNGHISKVWRVHFEAGKGKSKVYQQKHYPLYYASVYSA